MVLFERDRKQIATLNGIESAIRSLDGSDRTEAMYTEKKGEIILHIAGGGGNYLVSLTWPDRVLNLYGPDPDATDLVSFVAAGQMVEVPRGLAGRPLVCHPGSSVLRADSGAGPVVEVVRDLNDEGSAHG